MHLIFTSPSPNRFVLSAWIAWQFFLEVLEHFLCWKCWISHTTTWMRAHCLGTSSWWVRLPLITYILCLHPVTKLLGPSEPASVMFLWTQLCKTLIESQLPQERNVTGIQLTTGADPFQVLTPWSKILLEELTVTQLVKKFPAFCGTWRFISLFTGAHHWSLSWVRCIQVWVLCNIL
jgi:hypothetical protein